MNEPELYFDSDGNYIAVRQWSDLRDEPGKGTIAERRSLTDRSARSRER